MADFISGAIKRPGALTALVGGPPSQNLGKVRSIAANGTPLQKREANFYLNALRPAANSRRKAVMGRLSK